MTLVTHLENYLFQIAIFTTLENPVNEEVSSAMHLVMVLMLLLLAIIAHTAGKKEFLDFSTEEPSGDLLQIKCPQFNRLLD